MFKSRIINYSQNAEHRFVFSMVVERDAGLHDTRTLVKDIVQALPFILDDPAAQTWIEDLRPAGIELIVTGWVDPNATSIVRRKGEALRHVKLAIQVARIIIPDATQAIQISRDAVTTPALQESTQVEMADAALDRIVATERGQDDTCDLLREDSPKE